LRNCLTPADEDGAADRSNAWQVGEEPLEDHPKELRAWLVKDLSVIKLILR